MSNILFRFAVICCLALGLYGAAFAQGEESKKRKAFRITGKIALLTAKATARATFETVKFTGKHVIVPAFKHVVVPAAKAAPPIAWKAAKLTAKGIRTGTKSLIDRDDDRIDAAEGPAKASN